MKDINSPNCVIAFLDILGYESWIKKPITPNDILAVFEKILKKIEEDKAQFVLAQEFYKRTELTIWSDSLIYVLDMEGLDPEICSKMISIFLYVLSVNTSIKFLAETGYFLRGGISYGDFLQSSISKNIEHRFIFSRTFIDAVRLEKKAENPRILLSQKFIDFIGTISPLDQSSSNAIQKDIYGLHFLDIYSYLHPTLANFYIMDIKNKVMSKYDDIKNDEKERNKFLYFSDYHNKHIHKIFKARLTSGDFGKLGLVDQDFTTLKTLEYLGIIKLDSIGFFINDDIEPNSAIIAQRLNFAFSGPVITQMADIIKARILENRTTIQKHLISYQ